VKLGRKIKSVRTGRGITIQDIAERSGLSKGFLSQVENDKTSPSLNTLERIADALETPLTYLLLDEDHAPALARDGERQVLVDEASQGRIEFFSPVSGRALQMCLVDLPAGRALDRHEHAGEEVCWTLAGTVRITHGEAAVVLRQGDAYHWDGSVPHTIENAGAVAARFVIALSPPAGLRIVAVEAVLAAAPLAAPRVA
jgi:transcriptional regulator with XRE-family HTH domain